MKIDKYFHLYGRKDDAVLEEVKWIPCTEPVSGGRSMNDYISRQAAIKAYTASDRNGDSGYSIVVFATTAGQAKAYAAQSEAFEEYDFTDIRVNRRKELDRFYKGKREMDWMDDEDRVAMVRYANYECSCEVLHPECENGECPAQQWCGKYERRNNG